MKSQWKRLLLAAMISSSIFAATWFWYKSTDSGAISHGNEKPLAYVGKADDDIQRRPASRLLWQSISSGEALFNGEAIRTSDKGEARIQFAGSDRYLDLEPDSLIVIKKSEGEIALDLMEGSLFVNAKNGGAAADGSPGLVLNSANGKVDLTGASASLSKSGQSGISMQVLEGKASIQGKDGKSHDMTSGNSGALGANGLEMNGSSLQILSPGSEKPLYMDPDDMHPVAFHWKGFPANATVTLFAGPSRKNMKEVGSTTPTSTDIINAKMTLGRHFWKLVAKDATGKMIAESSTYRLETMARFAPTVIFPIANADVPTNTPAYDMNFKWQKGDETDHVTLEVWGDKYLKNQIASKTIKTEDNVTVPALKEGTYYWRMSAFFSDADKPVTGKIQKFTVKSSAVMNAEKKASRAPVAIAWNMPEAQQTQFYVDKPSMGLTWNANTSEEVAKYRVSVYPEGEDATQAKKMDVKENKLQTTVEKPGRYIASIEALDKDGDVMGSSQEKAITVSPLPLPTAPHFLPLEGVLQAGNDGRSELKWEKIETAKAYELTILKNGKELKKSRYPANATAIRNLMPGSYQVQINAIDEHGRSSGSTETRDLKVPDTSGLKAPTVKKIKVQ